MVGGILNFSRLAQMLALTILGLVAVYTEAAPIGVAPNARPSPDLLFCVVAYWAIRRPEAAPIPLVFAIGLARDFLTDLPVGAGALSLVLAAEVLKSQRRRLARTAFSTEWLLVAVTAIAASTLVWTLVVLTLARPPYMLDLAYQSAYTAMVYPLIALSFRWLLRISWRKPETV